MDIESIKDLTPIGRCIVSRSEKLLMVRLPREDVLKVFDIGSGKYAIFRASNESDDAIDDVRGLVFVMVKYRKREHFEQDLKEICER